VTSRELIVKRPLYVRMLRLTYVQPSALWCALFFEGSIVLAVLLSLAELVNWWAVLLLPVSVAALVKINDIVKGAYARSDVTRRIPLRRKPYARGVAPVAPTDAGPGRHGAGTRGTGLHGAGSHGVGRHGSDRHGSDRHGSDRHGTERHGTERHGGRTADVDAPTEVLPPGTFRYPTRRKPPNQRRFGPTVGGLRPSDPHDQAL
jgi:hypothetical protein